MWNFKITFVASFQYVSTHFCQRFFSIQLDKLNSRSWSDEMVKNFRPPLFWFWTGRYVLYFYAFGDEMYNGLHPFVCRWSYLPLHKRNFGYRMNSCLHEITASPTDVVVIKNWHDVSQKLYNLVQREIAYFCDSLHFLIFVLLNMSQLHKNMLLFCQVCKHER